MTLLLILLSGFLQLMCGQMCDAIIDLNQDRDRMTQDIFPLSSNEPPSYWVACSLVLEKFKTTYPRMDTVRRHIFLNTISEPLIIKKHTILIFPLGLPVQGRTCVIAADSTVTLLSSNCVKEFNEVISKESILVKDWDTAERIARLFIRMVIPMIAGGPIFFADELFYPSFKRYLDCAGRTELQNHYDEFSLWAMEKIYSVYQRKFKKELKKRKWLTQISKKDNTYNVTILTAGIIREGFGCYAPAYKRIIKWEIIVHSDGTVESKLPRGIKIYGIPNH